MCPLTKHLSVAQQLLAQCEEHHQQEEQGHDLQEVEDRSLPEEGRQDLQDCMQCPEIICLRKTKLQAAPAPAGRVPHTPRYTGCQLLFNQVTDLDGTLDYPGGPHDPVPASLYNNCLRHAGEDE